MITISATRRDDNAYLTPDQVVQAVEALKNDGFVVLENAVDPAHLDVLQERMLADVERIVARPDAPFNFNTGNLQQDPPPFHPFLFRDILFNEAAISVSRAVLGPGLKNTFYSGNTALPGGSRQPVHPDVAQLWRDLEHPTPAFGLVLNVPIVDVGPHNGATELWPGTHHDTHFCVHDGSARIDESHLSRWRQQRPPTQPEVKRGSLLLRDIRMWHAGMPNPSSQPRPMIAMIHWSSWWQTGESIGFTPDVEGWLSHPDLQTIAHFVPDEDAYLSRNQSYDLQK